MFKIELSHRSSGKTTKAMQESLNPNVAVLVPNSGIQRDFPPISTI